MVAEPAQETRHPAVGTEQGSGHQLAALDHQAA
jgi:hypothetical protein